MFHIKVKFHTLVQLIEKGRRTVEISEIDISDFTEEMHDYMNSVDNLSYNEVVSADEFIYVDLIMYDELMRLSNMNLI